MIVSSIYQQALRGLTPVTLLKLIYQSGRTGLIQNARKISQALLSEQTPGMIQHPPVHVDDLYDHIEMLKVNDNEKYSAEYESIEPGQQFTWDNR